MRIIKSLDDYLDEADELGIVIIEREGYLYELRLSGRQLMFEGDKDGKTINPIHPR